MTAEELFLRRLVVSLSGLVYWGGVLVQARRIRKRIGRSPNLRPRGAREQALWFGWFLVILAWIFQPLLLGTTAVRSAFTLCPGLLHPVGLVVGLLLILLGYAGTLWTYVAMGDTWRIGIDADEKTALVSCGPFRWVQHPIYSLQIVMLAGVALLLPTLVSLVTLAAHCFCVCLKARDEEKHLSQMHGTAYRDYASRTGRLFPRLIRRRPASAEFSPPEVDS